MDRSERIAVIVLFAGLLAWFVYAPRQASREQPADDLRDEIGTAIAPPAEVEQPLPVRQFDPVVEVAQPDSPETVVELRNERVSVLISSHGAAVKSVDLHGYRQSVDDADPVRLEFAIRRGLELDGVPDGSPNMVFSLEPGTDRQTATARRDMDGGIRITRTFELDDDYRIVLTDRFENTAGHPVALTNISVRTGFMAPVAGATRMRGVSHLDVDSLSDGTVTPWAKHINRLFGVRGGCARQDARSLPEAVMTRHDVSTEWIAAKNQFFVQILAASRTADALVVEARRDPETEALFDLAGVAGSLVMPAVMIEPGAVHSEVFSYYAGPKQFSRLRRLGGRQDAVMFRPWPGFGWWRWACIGLLYLLNGIHAVLPNYGVAIILLTVIVKLVFWPVTHKGNMHMKKMQGLQPELAKLREKHKDKPKKLQQAQMELYRSNGVNPLAGCLPMLVQIPVFIALFTVLRSAVELRFAGFLWIADLSEPEGLLAGRLPFPAGGLNILPLLMTATMVLQQRMTPATGDPQQQKMMMFMPLMMLFFFYSMPSALVLYWTISQSLSILQLAFQKHELGRKRHV